MQIFAAANTSLIPLKTTLIMKRNHVVRLHRILINLIKLIKIRKKNIFFHEQEHSQFAHTLDQLFFDLSWTLLLLILSIESEVNLITKAKILKSAGIFVFTMICRRFCLHNDMPKILSSQWSAEDFIFTMICRRFLIITSSDIFIFTMICRRFRLHNDMPKVSSSQWYAEDFSL